MNEPLRPRTGGQILIDQLRIHGVDMAFGVPGESYLAALDAMFEARARKSLGSTPAKFLERDVVGDLRHRVHRLACRTGAIVSDRPIRCCAQCNGSALSHARRPPRARRSRAT